MSGLTPPMDPGSGSEPEQDPSQAESSPHFIGTPAGTDLQSGSLFPNPRPTPVPRIALGQVSITSNAATCLPQDEVLVALARHAHGDWGDVDETDWATNDQAVLEGSRVLSAYHTSGGTRFWIISEWDRSATTVLLPEDY